MRCNNSSLYTGITTNVTQRIAEHEFSKQKGAKYLRGKGPFQLVFERQIGSKSLALKIEIKIKSLSKSKKEVLLKDNFVFETLLGKIDSV